jgi:hypothetical protein
MLRRNPRPVVRDFDERSAVVSTNTDGDAGPAVLEGVVDEVCDDSLEPARVAREHDVLCVEPHTAVPPARANSRPDERAEVDRLRLDALPPCIEAGDLHQVLD